MVYPVLAAIVALMPSQAYQSAFLDCGRGVYVSARPMVLDCTQAHGIILQARNRLRYAGEAPLSAAWSFVFRPERTFPSPVGAIRGFTSCETHQITVTAHRGSTVLHEMMHAIDCEAGEWEASARHKGWSRRGRDKVEEDFTNHKVTWKDGEP